MQSRRLKSCGIILKFFSFIIPQVIIFRRSLFLIIFTGKLHLPHLPPNQNPNGMNIISGLYFFVVLLLPSLEGIGSETRLVSMLLFANGSSVCGRRLPQTHCSASYFQYHETRFWEWQFPQETAFLLKQINPVIDVPLWTNVFKYFSSTSDFI